MRIDIRDVRGALERRFDHAPQTGGVKRLLVFPAEYRTTPHIVAKQIVRIWPSSGDR
jgi:hypothetical protein